MSCHQNRLVFLDALYSFLLELVKFKLVFFVHGFGPDPLFLGLPAGRRDMLMDTVLPGVCLNNVIALVVTKFQRAILYVFYSNQFLNLFNYFLLVPFTFRGV